MLDRVDKLDRTVLWWAARHGYSGIADVLVQVGVDIDKQDKCGYSALIVACRWGHAGVVRVILNRRPIGPKGHRVGCDFNLRTALGVTALAHATREGHGDIVRLLLSCGGDTNALDVDVVDKYRSMTPLLVAAQYDKDEIAAMLVQVGARLDAKDCNGATALHLAAGTGNITIVRILINPSAAMELAPRVIARSPIKNIGDGGNSGNGGNGGNGGDGGNTDGSASFKSARYSMLDAQRSSDGKTALIISAAGGYLPIVRVLVLAGKPAFS